MMRVLARRHSLKITEKEDIDESVASMTKTMDPVKLATHAKSVMKELNLPPKPTIRVPPNDITHAQINFVDGKLKLIKY